MYRKMKKPKIGETRFVGMSDDGDELWEKVIGVRKGSKPFRGYFPYFFTTTTTYRKKGRKK